MWLKYVMLTRKGKKKIILHADKFSLLMADKKWKMLDENGKMVLTSLAF